MPDYYLPPTGGGTGTLAGDVTGPSTSNTVGKIQGRNVSNAAPNDGYVLAWNAANNDWEPTVPSAILATGKVYEFENAASDIATYDQLRSNATGTEADLSVSITSGSGKTLIKSFASQLGSPDVTYIPAGQWDFDFYRYVSITAGISQLIFDVYIRTAGGSETLLFSVTSPDINDTVVTESSLTYSFPTETYINSTDRLVVKVSAITTSVAAVAVHFVFDGASHPSHTHTPIAGAAVTISGDVTGNTGNTTVVALRGKSLDSSLATLGASQDGYVLTWTNSANDWQAKASTGGGGTISTLNSQTFTSNGTWICPTGVTFVTLSGFGGGGGGGSGFGTSAGGGGGGSICSYLTIPVTPGTSYSITIGAGGAGGVVSGAAVPGSFGADTTFGSLATFMGASGGNGAGYGGGSFKNGGAANAYISNVPPSGTIACGGRGSVGGGAATELAGLSNITGGFAPGSAGAGAGGGYDGGGGGGAGPNGAGGNGGNASASLATGAGASAAANSGAGGGGGGGNPIGSGDNGGNGGSGQLTVSWVIGTGTFGHSVTTITNSYGMSTSNYVVVVGTIAAPITVTLPAGPSAGDTYIIKMGSSVNTTNTVTISPASGNIDGQSSFVCSSPYTSVEVVYNGTEWSII